MGLIESSRRRGSGSRSSQRFIELRSHVLTGRSSLKTKGRQPASRFASAWQARGLSYRFALRKSYWCTTRRIIDSYEKSELGFGAGGPSITVIGVPSLGQSTTTMPIAS